MHPLAQPADLLHAPLHTRCPPSAGTSMPVGGSHGAVTHGPPAGYSTHADTDMSEADSSAAAGGMGGLSAGQQGSSSAASVLLPVPMPLGRKGHKGASYHPPKTPTGKGSGGMPSVQGSGPSLRGSGRRDIDEMHAAAQVRARAPALCACVVCI